MSDDSVQKMILDELKTLNKKQDQIQGDVVELKTEFKLHQKESLHRWQTIEMLDKEQNRILDEHRSTGLAQQEANKIARAELEAKIENIQSSQDTKNDTLEEEIRALKEEVQEPKKFWKTLRTIAVYFTSIGSAVAMLWVLLSFLGIV